MAMGVKAAPDATWRAGRRTMQQELMQINRCGGKCVQMMLTDGSTQWIHSLTSKAMENKVIESLYDYMGLGGSDNDSNDRNNSDDSDDV